MTVITSENYGHLAHIRLNRPDQENRFTMQMTTDIGRAFTGEWWVADAGSRW